MSPDWLIAAAIIVAASFVLGLAGFGVGLVAMAFLPYVMSPVTAIVMLTIYTIVLVLVILVPLWRHLEPARVADMLAGALVGTPVGVWALSTFPVSTLKRLIGATLVAVALLEWTQARPRHLAGRAWGVGAGVLAGVAGGAVGTPGPPVILYAITQGWSPRTFKANLQAFFFVTEVVILAGYWWTGLVNAEVWRLAASLALPAGGGVALGMLCFRHVDPHRFRRLVFGLLMASGVVLLVRG